MKEVGGRESVMGWGGVLFYIMWLGKTCEMKESFDHELE